MSKYSREYYIKHRKEFNDRAMAYYYEHREYILAKRRLRRAAVKEYNRQYWLKHKNDRPKKPKLPEITIPKDTAIPWQIREYFFEEEK